MTLPTSIGGYCCNSFIDSAKSNFLRSSRINIIMARHNLCRQLSRPSESESRASHRRTTSGNANSCVSRVAIHLKAYMWGLSPISSKERANWLSKCRNDVENLDKAACMPASESSNCLQKLSRNSPEMYETRRNVNTHILKLFYWISRERNITWHFDRIH